METDQRSIVEFTFGELRGLAAELLCGAGMPEDAAVRTAWALAAAEAWGRASHGMLRLPHYLRRFAEGGTNAKATLSLVSASDALAVYDGGNGLGHWQAWRAAEEAAEKARAGGVGVVAVGNSGHCGVLGLHVLPMLEHDLVGLAFSNGPAAIPPWGGSAAVTSTSPLAAAIPSTPRPIIVDLATSAVARGRIAAAAALGERLPDGWAFDADGAPTNDPQAALTGMLAPLGGAKGFALALLVEALTGGIVGPHLAGDVADPLSPAAAGQAQRIAHLLIAVDPARLDVDGGGRNRLTELGQRVEAAGGRLPGASHLLPSEMDDDLPLSIPDALATTLRELTPTAAHRSGSPDPALPSA